MSDREETRPLLSWRQTPNLKSDAFGLFLMLSACAVHSCMLGIVKWSSATLSPLEIVVASSLVQATLGLFGCVYLRVNPFGQPGTRLQNTLRGVLHTIAMTTLFYALSCMPLGEVAAIVYIYPIITAMMAALYLNEPFDWLEATSSSICICAVVLITKPYYIFGKSSYTHHSAAFCAMVSTVLAASADTAVRNVPLDSMALVFVSGLISSIVALPALFIFDTFVVPSGLNIVVLLCIGVLAFLQQCLVERGLHLAPEGPAAMVRMTDLIFSFAIGFCIFCEYPDSLSIMGATVISIVSSVVAMKKWHSGH